MSKEDFKTKRVIGYIGSKVNLYDFLEKTIIDKHIGGKNKLFIDLFAGTCAVSKLVKGKTNWNILINDLAKYSRILASELSINDLTDNEFEEFKLTLKNFDETKLVTNGIFFNEFSMEGTPKTIDDLEVFNVKKKHKDEDGNVIKETNDNYQLHRHSRMFFKKEVGQKIDTIREKLIQTSKEGNINPKFKDLILLFLLNYANKNSNNTSVYGAYLKHDKLKNIKPFYDNDLLDYLGHIQEKHNKDSRNIYKHQLFAEEILDIKNTDLKSYNKKDIIVYMDPPYSTRSYSTNYHILEYLIDLNFNPIKIIKHNSKTGTPKTKVDNPFVSKQKTYPIFEELISKGLSISNNVYISYSNEGLLTEENMDNIIIDLNKKYPNIKLNTYYQEYKRFTSGENQGSNTGLKNTVQELVWHISNKD